MASKGASRCCDTLIRNDSRCLSEAVRNSHRYECALGQAQFTGTCITRCIHAPSLAVEEHGSKPSRTGVTQLRRRCSRSNVERHVSIRSASSFLAAADGLTCPHSQLAALLTTCGFKSPTPYLVTACPVCSPFVCYCPSQTLTQRWAHGHKRHVDHHFYLYIFGLI